MKSNIFLNPTNPHRTCMIWQKSTRSGRLTHWTLISGMNRTCFTFADERNVQKWLFRFRMVSIKGFQLALWVEFHARPKKGMKCCKIKSQVIHHDLNERKFNTSSRNAFAGCHWQSWKDFSVTQKQAKTCFRDFAQIKGFVLLKISTGWVTELEIAEKQVTALFTSRISLNSKRQTNNLQCFLDNEIVAQV